MLPLSSNCLIIFAEQLKVSARMGASRTFVQSFVAGVEVTAVAASPDNFRVALEYAAGFDVGA